MASSHSLINTRLTSETLSAKQTVFVNADLILFIAKGLDPVSFRALYIVLTRGHLLSEEGNMVQTDKVLQNKSMDLLQTAMHDLLENMKRVYFADYAKVKILLLKDPSFIFKHVEYPYPEGHVYISPLKHAFKFYDSYMWKMFHEAIKANPVWLKLFFEQLENQKDYLDLEPLLSVYRGYREVRAHYENNHSLERAVNSAWSHLGQTQLRLLPSHMIREMGRWGDRWSLGAITAFPMGSQPAPTESNSVFDYSNNLEIGWRNLEPFLLSCYANMKEPLSYALVRIGYDCGQSLIYLAKGGCPCYDDEPLTKLFFDRKNELEELRKLKPAHLFEEKPEPQRGLNPRL